MEIIFFIAYCICCKPFFSFFFFFHFFTAIYQQELTIDMFFLANYRFNLILNFLFGFVIQTS